MVRVLQADDAVRRIPDGATVLVCPLPQEELFPAFARVYQQTGSPKNLTVVWAAGLGPFSEERRGMNHFAYAGMVKRVIAGHVGLNYALVRLIAANQLEAYNLPQGIMPALYREMAAKRPGLLTRVGLGTFVDPRLEGGKMNERTHACENLVELVNFRGEEFLFYKAFPVDVGLIRGTAADPTGNITCDDEALVMEILEVAMAVKNSGGFVIAQVHELLDKPAHPHQVCVPDIFVDYVVVAQSRKAHPHTLFVDYDPAYVTPDGSHTQAFEPLPLNIEKVICRRAAMELRGGMSVNLGVGIPAGVAKVAAEEGILGDFTLSTELGIIGGVPEGGLNFGPAKHPRSIITQTAMFDYYDGGGLDLTCVGLAQADKDGNVNVSKIGPKLIGSGGFINITQSSKKCIFCGEFTAGGLDAVVEDGRLVIRKEGRIRKFVDTVEQITYSGKYARQFGQEVLFITERCVFKLVPEGLMLTEVAPGVDIQSDILANMGFVPIVPENVPLMNPAIFAEPPLGLKVQRA